MILRKIIIFLYLNILFLDKFWNNIKEDIWIYIDDNMLKYIGYNRSEYKKNKQDYLNILKENFEFDNDYKLLFSKEFEEFAKRQKLALSNSTAEIEDTTLSMDDDF